MAIDYDNLVAAKNVSGSIRNRVNHADIPVEAIVEEAEAAIYQELRTWEMRVEASGTVGVGEDSLALPDRFIAPIKLVQHGGSPDGLRYWHEQNFPRYKDVDGALMQSQPTKWTIHNGLILFDTENDVEFGYDFWFYQQPPALGPSNLTNFLTIRFPTLILRACLMLGYEHRRNWEAHARFEKRFLEALARANTISDNARLGMEI